MSVQLIIYKISQRCNLDCSYCYVYHGGDNSWETRPAIAQPSVTQAIVDRICDQKLSTGVNRVAIELHGGEPLLLGIERFSEHLEIIRQIDTAIDLELYVQTNGLLLNRAWLRCFKKYGIKFGISLDGPAEVNDKHRVDHLGRGSFFRLHDRIAELCEEDEFVDTFSGVLAVIDVRASGRDVLEWFHKKGIGQVDLLLPDRSWLTAGVEEVSRAGEFLIDAFDFWLSLDSSAPRVRFFEYALRTCFGYRRDLDALGGSIATMCVVESDGSIYPHDVLRTANGAVKTPSCNVFENQFSDTHLQAKIKQLEAPAVTCISCRFFRSCGGGYLPHRWDGNSLSNPSVYCEAYKRFYAHVEAVLHRIARGVAHTAITMSTIQNSKEI